MNKLIIEFDFKLQARLFESINRDCQTLNYSSPWTDFDCRWPSGTGSLILLTQHAGAAKELMGGSRIIKDSRLVLLTHQV